MKKILLYTFIAAASALATSCNDYLDCEPITSVSTNVYLYSETDLAAYAAKFYNDSENENDDEYGNILPSHGSATYNLGLFQKDNGTDDQTADSPSKLFIKGQYHVGDDDYGINISVRYVQLITLFKLLPNDMPTEKYPVMMQISNTILARYISSVLIFISQHCRI